MTSRDPADRRLAENLVVEIRADPRPFLEALGAAERAVAARLRRPRLARRAWWWVLRVLLRRRRRRAGIVPLAAPLGLTWTRAVEQAAEFEAAVARLRELVEGPR